MPDDVFTRIFCCVQSCFSPLGKDTVYLRQEGNAASDVEAVLKIDPELHTGVRLSTTCVKAGSCACLTNSQVCPWTFVSHAISEVALLPVADVNNHPEVSH